MRGKFISFEGGDGAGKSTQAERLAESLRARGVEVVCTREVGGSPGAEAIRDLWLGQGEGYWDHLGELLLIMAARREHLVRTIWPHLERGVHVISDRFHDSTRAYQGIGLGMGTEITDRLYGMIAPGFTPDLTLLLDLPVADGFGRMMARGGQDDRYQQKDAAFHEKLRAAYLDFARAEPCRFAIIDAARGDIAVTAAIAGAVRDRLGL